jgi:uncharacterized membrane protein YbhN (UPF0104 family)
VITEADDSFMKKMYRNALRIGIVIITACAFAYFLFHHPEILSRLVHTPLRTILGLVGLYLLWFGALALTVHATLRICRRPLGLVENVLLNAYSTLVNFFVPGQGGVAVRGLYMKRQHQLGFRHYILATLLYYMSYAVVSALLLLVTSRPWWQTCLGVALVAMGSVSVVYIYERRSDTDTKVLNLGFANLAYLLMATLLQAAVQISVNAFELRTINPDIAISQVVTYTGAANFALFVALTPGAIGIRESFLLFSRQLHHVSTATIVAASVIDRAVFLVLLGILFLLTLIFHARKFLKID